MARSKRIDDWIASVNGKSTFAGVIVDFFDEMCEDNYWRAESTRKHYIAIMSGESCLLSMNTTGELLTVIPIPSIGRSFR